MDSKKVISLAVEQRPLLETLRLIDPGAHFGVAGDVDPQGGLALLVTSAYPGRIASALDLSDRYAVLRDVPVLVKSSSANGGAQQNYLRVAPRPPVAAL